MRRLRRFVDRLAGVLLSLVGAVLGSVALGLVIPVIVRSVVDPTQ